MVLTRSEFRDAINEMSDEGMVGTTEVQLTVNSDVADRAINDVVADLSRIISKKAVREIVVRESASNEYTIGTGAGQVNLNGTVFQLPDRLIEYGSVSIGSKIEHTDYLINYFDGTISLKGSSWSNGNTLIIQYKRSRLSFDVSEFTDLHQIRKVEYLTSAGPTTINVERWGDTFTISGTRGRDQTKLNDKAIVRIYYDGIFSIADTNSAVLDGPEWLDAVVIKGAAAYVLRSRARLMLAIAEYILLQAYSGLPTASDESTTQNAFLTNPTLIDPTDDDVIDELDDRLELLMSDSNSNPITVALVDVSTEYDTATGYLNTGHDFNNTITTGARVGENYREYAQAQFEIAQGEDRAKSRKVEYLLQWANIAIQGYAAKASLINANTQQLNVQSADGVGRTNYLQQKIDKSRTIGEIALRLRDIAELLLNDAIRKQREYEAVLTSRAERGDQAVSVSAKQTP